MEKYGLLGEHLGHSYSPFIHEAFGFYHYDLKETAPQDVERFMMSREWEGINVGIPYKKTVIPCCHIISDRVKKIGAANTIKKLPDGRLFAENTDYYGFLYMSKKAGVDFKGRNCVIFGHGGASLACAAAIRDNGGYVRFVDLSTDTANGDPVFLYSQLDELKDAEIAVQTTPVGMYPLTDASIVSLKDFPRLEAALDVVYNPVNTRFIQEARALGLPNASGLSMLVAQAKKSCEIFTGKALPDEIIEDVLKKLENSVSNIVLIGMPGCGKNTIGQALAERTGMKFAGTDEEILRRTGRNAAAIILEDGEGEFRRLEAEVAQDLCKEKGTVIACGGGIVKTPGNFARLSQNGKIVWLLRDLDKLATVGRPLSKGGAALSALWCEREPLYRTYADFTADNNGTIEETVEWIIKALI